MLKTFLSPTISSPSFTWKRGENPDLSKVQEWIKPITDATEPEESKNADAILFGVPLSRSSISASGASEFPEAFRRSWRSFSTYNLDEDIDLSEMRVLDAGDVPMHVTDIPKCHKNILRASAVLHHHFTESVICAIGGDHSITAMLVKGMHQETPHQKIGILQFDTHFDLRDLAENGPSNGTPMRNLIENGVIKGSNLYTIGLHGFFNTKDLKRYAEEQGINYISIGNARKRGIAETVRHSLERLASKVDFIYVTIDMDVLDIAFAPGVPASTPGGMTTSELLEGVFEAGKHPKVKAMDVVCLDPLRDSQVMATVKLGTHVFLTFLSGVCKRL